MPSQDAQGVDHRSEAVAAVQTAPFPGACSLLDGGSEPLFDLLSSYGFEYDREINRFRCEEIDYAGYNGSMLLTALGDENADGSRRMSPESLRSGMPLQAIQLTLFFSDTPESAIAGDCALMLFEELLSMDGIDKSDVIRKDVAPISEYTPPISCMGAKCHAAKDDAFWAATVDGWAGFTCSCSLLDYYLAHGGGWQVKETEGDVVDPYDSIGDISPWDIPIVDGFEDVGEVNHGQ